MRVRWPRRPRSVRSRLVVAFVAVLLLAAAILSATTLSLVRRLAIQRVEAQLRQQAAAVGDSDLPNAPCLAKEFLSTLDTRVFLVVEGTAVNFECPNRRLVAGAPFRPGEARPPALQLDDILGEGEVRSGRRSGQFYAVAPRRSGPGNGVLLTQPVRGVGPALVGPVAIRLLAASLVALVVAVIVAVLVAGRLAAPLGRLSAAARRLGRGELSTRVGVSGDDEVAEVAGAFNDMASALEASRSEQQAFIASVGHELRTPLTTVQGYTEALLDGAVVGPEERRRSLERIHAETLRLARLVSDLQDLARLGRGQFSIEAVDQDAAAVVEEAGSLARDRAAARGVPVEIRLPAGPLPAHVDPDRLRQVLDNLLENAVRSSQAGMPVVLAGRRLPEGPVEVAVIDRGPGIAIEDLPRAFDRGYLWERYRGTRTVGSGLGLSIVRALCDAMGVRIWAERAEPNGTAFRLRLPPPHRPLEGRSGEPATNRTAAAPARHDPVAPRGHPPRGR